MWDFSTRPTPAKGARLLPTGASTVDSARVRRRGEHRDVREMSCLGDGGGGGDGGVAGCGRRAGRAGRRRPSPYPLLAGAVHPQSLLVRRHQGPGGSLAGARTAGPLRRGGPHGPGARRRPADGGERRRRGRPAVRHMDAEAGNRLVRRHAVHRRRRGLHRRILPARGGGLQRGLQLHRRDDAGGPRRPHRQDRVRRPQAVPLRAVRRHRLADPPEGPVRGLPRDRGLRGGEFPAPSARDPSRSTRSARAAASNSRPTRATGSRASRPSPPSPSGAAATPLRPRAQRS